MERETNQNRTLWIILGTVLLLLALCGCLAVVVGGSFLLITGRQADISMPEGYSGPPEIDVSRVTDRVERSIEVGAQPTLEVDNFAGAITIRAGEPGVIQIVATRRAPGRGDLDNIRIEWEERENGVKIVTSLPSARFSNRAVDLDIEVPVDATVVIDNGAGEVRVEGVAGELDLHTGAGEVLATGAMAGARLDTGAGSVRYEGNPTGDVKLQTGAGSITILVPADANVDLDLSTGVGSVDVDDFYVTGDVSLRSVQGSIGRGGPTIKGHTGAGSIDVRTLR